MAGSADTTRRALVPVALGVRLRSAHGKTREWSRSTRVGATPGRARRPARRGRCRGPVGRHVALDTRRSPSPRSTPQSGSVASRPNTFRFLFVPLTSSNSRSQPHTRGTSSHTSSSDRQTARSTSMCNATARVMATMTNRSAPNSTRLTTPTWAIHQPVAAPPTSTTFSF